MSEPRPVVDQTPLRRRVFNFLERVDGDAFLPRLFAAALIVLILVNVFAAVMETEPWFAAANGQALHVLWRVSLIVFAVEYVVRTWVSVEHPRAMGKPAWRARLAYMATPGALIDLIAVLPFVLTDFFDVNLRVVLMLRLLRLFKLGRYSTGFQSLIEAIRRERAALLASFLVLASIVLIAASFAYMAERDVQPEKFGTIPLAAWWAIATVTTVGYGDVVPHTVFGRMVGGITMIAGILMIALPVAIIGTSFAEVIRQRSFVITFGMMSRIKLFARLGPDLMNEIFPVLRALTIDSGLPIYERGESGQALFVIVDGAVEVDYPSGRQQFRSGDAFGATPMLDTVAHSPPALAVTRVKLLVLERADLMRFLALHPDLAGRLRPTL